MTDAVVSPGRARALPRRRASRTSVRRSERDLDSKAGRRDRPGMAASARIVFDDVLLADRRLVELFADGEALEGAGEVALVELEPRQGRAAVDLRECGRDVLDAAALLANLDLVAGLEQVRRDV